MHHQPDGPAFDVVLIAHVGCVVVSLATFVASASSAARLRTVLVAGTAVPDAVARFFRPGVNWAGRSVYGVPVFGFLLLTLSQGAYSLRQGWVMAGLSVFVLLVLVGEGVLWPAERRLQVSLPLLRQDDVDVRQEVLHDTRAMVLSASLGLVLVLLGSALMLVQP